MFGVFILRLRAVLLSLVMPGLGQILNRQYIKAIVFLLLEHAINRLSFLNQALLLDMNGMHKEALGTINFQYALFYPGFYVMCALDSVINAKETNDTKFVYWFILAGITGTVGIIYSRFIPTPVFTVGVIMVVLIIAGTIDAEKRNK